MGLADIAANMGSGQNRIMITENCTWQVPMGVNRIIISACAAGEDGSTVNYNYKAKAGEFVMKKIVTVKPGQRIPIVVGAGNTVIGNIVTLVKGTLASDFPNNYLGVELGRSGYDGCNGGDLERLTIGSSEYGGIMSQTGGKGGKGGYGGAFGIGGSGAGGCGIPGNYFSASASYDASYGRGYNGAVTGTGGGGTLNGSAGEKANALVRTDSAIDVNPNAKGSSRSELFFTGELVHGDQPTNGTASSYRNSVAGNAGNGVNATKAIGWGSGGGACATDAEKEITLTLGSSSRASCTISAITYGSLGKSGIASAGTPGMVLIEW
ncbi:hypothetical protein [Anaerolentibacter hominis]|uniref:hypothetical protein n=1 Tax=Anaerolentibacter hominis TaxID=3079009 RepID=UPI0031B835D6